MRTHINTNDVRIQEPHHTFLAARQALRRHAGGGNLLIAAAILAMAVANIPGLNSIYFSFWNEPVRLQIGDFNVFSHAGQPMTVLAVINDALMAIFFFTIGLEIKREILVGELSSVRQALLPIVAAIGGMAMPVLIYLAMAGGTDYAGGAAIPMATDIAFSLGVLAMLGSRVPISLKIFLTTLAVVDDIGGIIVIAAFYSGHIDPSLLIWAAVLLAALWAGGNLLALRSKIFYIAGGGAVWFLFLNSGIHPTIAGVLVAFCVPATPVLAPKKYVKIIRTAIAHFREGNDETLSARTILDKEQMNWLKEIESASDKVISPLQELEDSLHPIVNYAILPLFAFANAGIYLLGIAPASVVSGISLAVIAALVIGKFTGILLFSWLTVRLRLAPMPESTDWHMIASVAMLGGIGFTVSLFIANLSFGGGAPADAVMLGQAKLGIVAGSVLAGTGGFIWLHRTLPRQTDTRDNTD